MAANSLQIALVEPEIPMNTGSIGRTCVATGTPLHLIGQLGFSLDDRYLKRAGLDYWVNVKLHCHADWPTFVNTQQRARPDARLVLFSKKAEKCIYDFVFQPNDVLVFGKETKGLSEEILAAGHPTVRIPTPGPVRSLNLATASGIALYEALRQLKAW